MSFTWSAAIRCGCLAHSLALSLFLCLFCFAGSSFCCHCTETFPLTRTQTQRERDTHEAPMEVITGQKCSNVCDLRSNNNWLQLFVVALVVVSELSMASWRWTTFCSIVVAFVRGHYWPPRRTFWLFAIILCKIIYEACNVLQICIDRFEYERKW